MAETSPQRVYRAACPGCGAPVEFRSAQSTYAVCTYCRSTVVRDGESLSRLGRMAELFDDHSPLQMMVRGSFGDKAFTLVGRLQYRSGSGTWTEWNVVFDDGSSAVLAEDNGAYVFARDTTVQRDLPPASALRVGRTTAIGGNSFTVASNEQGALISAQGELPRLPPVGSPFAMVELRSAQGEVLSIDYGTVPPVVTRGHAVQLDALALSGLREENIKTEGARQFSCPNCGAPVGMLLDTSKSVTCPSCNSVIDVSQGIGGELRHAMQSEPVQPLIALGATGQLQGVQWQVVGFQHRMGTEPGEEDEQFGWSEYLLYQRKRGFVFLVDSEDGWSVVKPVTGAPTVSASGSSAKYLGTNYQLLYAYSAETTYVAGEFYWPVERGQKSFNRDFAAGSALLSMEETPREITWSSGSKIDSDTVAKAFGLEGKKDQLARSDASPVSMGSGGMGCMTIVVLIVVIVFLVVMMRACTSGGTGGAWRSTGGSYGGYSSGGGHK